MVKIPRTRFFPLLFSKVRVRVKVRVSVRV